MSHLANQFRDDIQTYTKRLWGPLLATAPSHTHAHAHTHTNKTIRKQPQTLAKGWKLSCKN